MRKKVKILVYSILKFLMEVIPKKNKILCNVEFYRNGKIKEDDNVYIFSKYLFRKKEKISYCEKKLNFYSIFDILTSKVVLHKTYPIPKYYLNKKTKNIVLGYFTPFKADRYLEKMCLKKGGKNFFKELEECNKELPKSNLKYITCSKYASTIIAKSNNISINNFVEIGLSRNFVKGVTEEKFRKIFSIPKEKLIKKIVLFTPTFRDKFTDNLEEFSRKDENIFGYDNLCGDISNILKKNNMYIVIKLHRFYPYYEEKEEKILSGEILLPENCVILSQKIEQKYNIGIYNLFDISDAMIADYSSISFDYLLKDKPIFYNIFDIDEYREYRGFSYEPIEDLMAGEIIKTKEKFLECLDKFGENYKDIYKEKRKKVSLLVNGEKQENINEKIYKFIKEYTNDK